MKCEGTQYRWIFGELVTEVITSDVQALAVKFDQEVSIDDMKNTQTGELRSVEGSSDVSKESPVGARAERCNGEERAGDAERRENHCCVH